MRNVAGVSSSANPPAAAGGKSFFIETFGCQMNDHDSEKVAGVLQQRGYQPVATPAQADLVLYNTCSIREKAEQKVFSRLQQFKREAGKGKVFGVLGCVAQQEGERIFERAPHVSLVAGSASYTKLPELLVQLEAGNRLAGRHDSAPKIGLDGKYQFNSYDLDGTRLELMDFHATIKPCCSPFTAEDQPE